MNIYSEHTEVSPDRFLYEVKHNSKTSAWKACVKIQPIEYYREGVRIALFDNATHATTTAHVSPNGELSAVTKAVNATSDQVNETIKLAIYHGAICVSCRDTALPELFEAHGFVKVDEEYQIPGVHVIRRYENQRITTLHTGPYAKQDV